LLFVFAPAIAVAAGVFDATLFVTEFQNGKHRCYYPYYPYLATGATFQKQSESISRSFGKRKKIISFSAHTHTVETK
jgi:hypothetical protein